MRINLLRSVALTLGLCSAGAAPAQYGGYPAPYPYPYGAPPQAAWPYPGGPAPDGSAAPAGSAPGAAAPNAAAPSAPAPYAPPYAPTASMQPGGGAAPQADPRLAVLPPSGYSMMPHAYRTAAAPEPPQGSEALLPPPAGHPHAAQPQPMPHGAQPMHHGHAHPHSHGAPAPGYSLLNGGGVGSGLGSGFGSGFGPGGAGPWGGFGAAGVEPCELAPPVPIRPWFGGANLLFFDFHQDETRRLVHRESPPFPSTDFLGTEDVSPGASTGFETFFGRYLGCGQYAISGTYFFLDPGMQEAFHVGTPGSYRANFRNWDRVQVDPGGGGMPIDFYDGFAEPELYRVRRNVSFQGLELNLHHFGIGGAQRAGFPGDACSTGCAPGCGGVCGPMVAPAHSRLQIGLSQGFRWFQFRDDFQFAASYDDDYFRGDDDDFYYDVRTENNLFGYQLGSMLSYCLGKRWNAYAGARFGIYGNHATYRSRMGTADDVAYVGMGLGYPEEGEAIDVRRRRTVLATLGELDMGLGVRLTDCWSLRGGYRILGVTGVATSVGAISDDPANLNAGHRFNADDSIVLHGGYVGVNYNW